MRLLALSSSLFAIVGSVVGLTLPATAIGTAFFSKTTQAFDLPSIANQEVRLTQILLPAGRWIVNYSATAVNAGTNDAVRCYVRARETGEILSIHGVFVGGEQGASYASTISGVTLVNLSEPTTMVLTCTRDRNGTGIYIDPGAELAAY